MRKLIRFAMLLLRRNRFFTILFAVEVLLCLIQTTTTVNQYRRTETEEYIGSRPGMEYAIAFFSGEEKITESGIPILLPAAKYLKEYRGVAVIHQIETKVLESAGKTKIIRIMTPETAKLFMPHARIGKDPELSGSDILRVLAVSSIHSDGETDVGDMWKGSDINDQDTYTIEVTGSVEKDSVRILKSDKSYYAGDEITADVLFKPVHDVYGGEYLAICESVQSESSFALLQFPDNASMLSAVENLKQHGSVFRIPDLVQRSRGIQQMKIIRDLPYTLMWGFLIAVSMVSMSYLNMKKDRRRFAIARLCGASKEDCIFGYWLGLVIILFSVYLCYRTGITVLKYIYAGMATDYFRISPTMNVLIIGMLLAISAIGAIPVVFMVNREDKYD